MDLLSLIKKRRSIRKFQKKEIPQKFIEKLIEALIWAPSAGNLQSRKFYFVFNQKIKEKIAEAALNQEFIKEAPLVIVACKDEKIERVYGKRGKELYAICDVSASIENLLLVAENLGLGSVWIGAFEEREIIKILNLPENLIPLAILPLGYPAERPKIPKRISKEKAVEFVK
jgi:nitroreductase